MDDMAVVRVWSVMVDGVGVAGTKSLWLCPAWP